VVKTMPDVKGTLLQIHAKLFSLGFRELPNGKFVHDKYWYKIQPSVAKGKYILSVGISTRDPARP
jgi:hypothetical protein